MNESTKMLPRNVEPTIVEWSDSIGTKSDVTSTPSSESFWISDTRRVEYPSLPFMVLADHKFLVPLSAPVSRTASPNLSRGRKIKRLEEHENIVRAVSVGRGCIVPTSHLRGQSNALSTNSIEKLSARMKATATCDKWNETSAAPTAMFYSGGFSPF
eukprot:CFRG7389T1